MLKCLCWLLVGSVDAGRRSARDWPCLVAGSRTGCIGPPSHVPSLHNDLGSQKAYCDVILDHRSARPMIMTQSTNIGCRSAYKVRIWKLLETVYLYASYIC